MNSQKLRNLIAVAAFASLGAPFAAHADAPSGDFDANFPLSSHVKKAQFPVNIVSGYNSSLDYTFPHVKLSAAESDATRAKVLQDLATMPAERVGS